MTISIVIPSYNGQKLLQQHLPAVRRALSYWETKSHSKGEIIVVDDASSDDTSAWLKNKYPDVRCWRNSRNFRFAASCNLGVRQARGDVVILLNNDVEPDINFITPLVGHFRDAIIFAIGCRERNLENGQEAWGGLGVMKFSRGLVIHWRPKIPAEATSTAWISGGSAAFRRETWQKLGGFDRLFRPAYEEDRDLSWQAIKAGYRLLFEPASNVYHHHETTNKSAFGNSRITIYSLKNQLLFVWKNISSFRLLLSHLGWLPYHLIVTTWRTKGLFLAAFSLALWQLPEALAARGRASRLWKFTDEEILEPRKV